MAVYTENCMKHISVFCERNEEFSKVKTLYYYRMGARGSVIG
jgi:hypothetical protein